MSASTTTAAKPKKTKGQSIWGWALYIVPLLLLVLLVRSCATAPETATVSTRSGATSTTQTVVTRSSNAPVYLEPPSLPKLAAPAPAAVAMNMCAPFSVVHQICALKPFEHGKGYIDVTLVPPGWHVCYRPAAPDPSVGSVWAYTGSGDEVPATKATEQVVALEIVPTRAIKLSYWAQKDPCALAPSLPSS